MKPIVFIFGPLSVNKDEFDINYVQLIKSYLEKNANFIICDAAGVDSETQKYLASIFTEQEQEERITVYHMYESPRNLYCDAGLIGGFLNDKERDKAATYNSHFDIGISKRLKSGTEKNHQRRIKFIEEYSNGNSEQQILAKKIQNGIENW